MWNIFRIFTYQLTIKTNKVMEQSQKYTSLIVDEFRHQLLKRREYLIDLADSFDPLMDSTIAIVNEERDRIQNILKLIQKGKI